MKQLISIIFLSTLFLLFILSCVDKIDLKIEKGFERSLFIEGKLVKGEASSIVYAEVSRIFDFTATSIEIVNVKGIVLEEEGGGSIELEDRTRSGLYFKNIINDNPEINLLEGKKYRLRVSTFDGEVYESAWEELLVAPTIDSVVIEKETKSVLANQRLEIYEDRDYFNFNIYTQFDESKEDNNLNLKWEFAQTMRTSLYGNIRYILKEIADPVNLSEIPVLEGDLFPLGGDVPNYTILDMPIDSRFAEGYNLKVNQQALSKAAYQFYAQTNQLLNRTGNAFESPSGQLSSNFKNITTPEAPVFGIFYATTEQSFDLCVSPELANFPPSLNAVENAKEIYGWHLDGILYNFPPSNWIECE